MGYDIPAAIGVRLAQAGGEVLILMGDGNYQLHPMELVTAMQERGPRSPWCSTSTTASSPSTGTRRRSSATASATSSGSAIRRAESWTTGPVVEIDYVKNAESIGLRAWLANTEEEVRDALAAARNETRPCMIVVETERYRFTPDAGVWWEVVGAEVTGDPKTRGLVAAREEGRAKQRFHH